jgi:hypothetical protein
MIYLKSKNLIFIKPLKTASTSLEIAFACNAKPEDIVTRMTTSYELMRLEMGAQLPVNYMNSRATEARYRAKIRILNFLHKLLPHVEIEAIDRFIKPFCMTRGKKLFFNHIKPTEVAAILGDKFLEEAFVVTMCRHPYEVLVSRAYWERWKKQKLTQFDVSAAVDEILEKEPLNLDYYFHNGKFVPDFVIRYEHLLEDIAELERKFGLNLIQYMPKTKNKLRKSEESAADVLTEKQKKICYEKNRPIFERFGYAP